MNIMHTLTSEQKRSAGPNMYKDAYHFPGEGLVPEGGALLQAEEGPSYRGPEGCRHACCCTHRHKVPLVPGGSQTTVPQQNQVPVLITRSKHCLMVASKTLYLIFFLIW